MNCERCGKKFDKDYRKDKRGTPRFCSFECSKKRKLSEESKKKISERSKALWEDEEYRKKMKERIPVWKKGTSPFTKEQLKRGCETQKINRDLKHNLLLKEGNYDDMSISFRRKQILKEVNNACEICGNSEWLEQPIWLEIHHKDGNSKNNKRDNLIVVCLNCHSVIDKNYRFTGRSVDGSIPSTPKKIDKY